MISKVFWTIRFAIVVLGTAACFISIGVVLRLKLNNRLPMLYAVFIAICQSIICLTALIFGIGSAILVQNDSFNPEDYPAIMILCQLQAALFHSSELISYSLTALLSKILYDALKGKDIHAYEFKARIACFSIPIILAVVMAALRFNGFCTIDLQQIYSQDPKRAYFNSSCLNPQYRLAFYLMYILPTCLLGLTTFTFLVLIRIQRRKLEFNNKNSIDHQLALIVHNIPSYSFLIYILSIIFLGLWPEVDSIPALLAHQVSFLIPVVTMITVLIYRKYYLIYSREGSLLLTTSLSLR